MMRRGVCWLLNVIVRWRDCGPGACATRLYATATPRLRRRGCWCVGVGVLHAGTRAYALSSWEPGACAEPFQASMGVPRHPFCTDI